ncbi:hypothetical protein HZS_6594 [Henneguya salminicola]|nr:hypothetical protein HZS_6594 [Henneguya salminicola]
MGVISTFHEGDLDKIWASLITLDFSIFSEYFTKFKSKPYLLIPFKIYFINYKTYQFQYQLQGDNDTVSDLLTSFNSIYEDVITETYTRVILQGIQVEHETHLIWLIDNMPYADGFAHLVLLN